MVELNHLNICESIRDIKVGDVLIIKRRRCSSNILVVCKEIVNGAEIILSKNKNDYFNFDMYMSGKSWVSRVWNLGQIKITNITNTTQEFAR